jgi:hypothetical protein
MWEHEVASLRPGWVQRITVLSNGVELSYGEALRLLEQDASFRQYLTRLLAGSTNAAFRWETPPVSVSDLDRPFEFVVTNDPHLEMRPDPTAFASYFTGANAEAAALAIPNLCRTAMLVVPRQLGEAAIYTHFARFLRRAPSHQVHALWQCVAETAQQRLSAKRQWISTAGGGVAWLHVRIENVPKYYSYKAYVNPG